MDLEQEAHTFDPDVVFKLLLRLANSHADSQEMLWTLEPELVLRDNAFYIPTVWPIDDLNALSDTQSKEVTVKVVATSRFVLLDERGQLAVGQSYQNDAQAQSWEVLTSSVHKLRLWDEQQAKRLCVLRNSASEQTVLVLTRPKGSTVTDAGLDILWRYDKDGQVANYSHQLHHLLTAALAGATLQGPEGRVWVHGAPACLAKELDLVASHSALPVHQ